MRLDVSRHPIVYIIFQQFCNQMKYNSSNKSNLIQDNANGTDRRLTGSNRHVRATQARSERSNQLIHELTVNSRSISSRNHFTAGLRLRRNHTSLDDQVVVVVSLIG